MNLTKTKSSEIAIAVRASAVTALLLLTLGYAAPDARATVAPGPYNGSAATVGTEFWFAFGENLIEGTNYVNISGTTATTATVAVPALGFSVDVSVTPGQTTSVAVPTGTDLQALDGVESLGVHVTSAAPVTVYGLEDATYTTDGFTALPVTAIGRSYYALGYEALQAQTPQSAPSDFQVVGTHDGTTVTITPAAAAGAREAGVPYTVELNAGQTYQLIGNSGADLTGTHITSSAPVSVLAGAECANIPSLSYVACNYVAEQMPPTPEWGKDFLTEPLATRTLGDTFRILAGQASTTVAVNGGTVATLEAGQFYQTQLTEASSIITSHPALVAQFSDSTTFDNLAQADPSETLVPPTEQFLHSYTYTTPVNPRFTNYINVIAPNNETGSLLLDGGALPGGDSTAIGSSGFSGAQVPVGIGTHTLTGAQAFGLTAYGFGEYDAYSYPGGYAASSSTTNPAVNRYVALGDSYSSGEGALDINGNPGFYPATNISGGSKPNQCHRSTHAYPELVRNDPRVAAQAFTFAACSGAKLPDLIASLPRATGTGKQGGQWGEKAQLDRIAPAGSADSSVSLVTFTISGNDFGFSEILSECVGGAGHPASTSSCSAAISKYRTLGTKILKNGAAVHIDENGDGNYTLCSGPCTASYDVHIPPFSELLTQVHKRAPNARIIVVGYPHLFPETLVSNCTVGGSSLFTHYSITPANDGLMGTGQEYVDNLIREIVQQAAAQGLNARFADPRARFVGHDVCQVHDSNGQPQTHAWINGLLFNNPLNPSSYSFHPNAAGQKTYAELVAACYAKATSCGYDPFH